jgi:hypothetical protein
MQNANNTGSDNPRTLEITLMIAMQRRQWLIFILFTAMTCALLWLAVYGVTREPFFTSSQLLVTVVMAVMTLLRIRYLRSLFLRIDDNGFSWRLIDGVEFLQQMRPPISEHALRWESVRALHHEATGIRFHLNEKKDVFLPLSNFSYTQRQDIKRAIGLHASEYHITIHAFTPVGWHDEPEVESGEVDEARLHASPTTETR